MKSAGKARNNGLYRHIRTSKEIIRNLLNDSWKDMPLPALHQRTVQATDKNVPTDCVCSGAH